MDNFLQVIKQKVFTFFRFVLNFCFTKSRRQNKKESFFVHNLLCSKPFICSGSLQAFVGKLQLSYYQKDRK